MPRVKKYPQWVHDLCPKGHTIKEKNGNYYLYKTTSKYRPGKSPLPVSSYVGRITQEGIQYSSKKRFDTDIHPCWYEYGFSLAFYQTAFPVLKAAFKDEEKAKSVILRIICKYSPKSYLLKDQALSERKDVCLSNQEAVIEKKTGKSMEEFLKLRDILIIELPNRPIITAATDEEEALLKELEVTLHV